MRRRIAIVIVAAALGGVALADAFAPQFLTVVPGSYGFPIDDAEMTRVPVEEGCEEDAPTADHTECPVRYAFVTDASLTVWLSIRNEGPFDISLEGVSRQWLDQYMDLSPLGKPVAGLDGGAVERAAAEGPRRDPSHTLTLHPGENRPIGVDFRTITDVGDACEDWGEGSGVQWDFAPITWRWLFFEHELELQFPEPIVFMAPTSADCQP